jgi:hypothetical protein
MREWGNPIQRENFLRFRETMRTGYKKTAP